MHGADAGARSKAQAAEVAVEAGGMEAAEAVGGAEAAGGQPSTSFRMST